MYTFLKSVLSNTITDEYTRQGYILRRLLLGAWSIPILILGVSFFVPQNSALLLPILAVIATVLTIITVQVSRGSYRSASLLLVISLILIGLFLNYLAAGETRPAIIFFAWITVAAGLLLGSRAALITAVLFSVEQVTLVILALNGVIAPLSSSPIAMSGAIVSSIGYVLVAITFGLAANSIQSALTRVIQKENDLVASNAKLEDLTHSLEQRVNERTASLEKRAAQLKLVSNVAHAIASIQDLDTLLPFITRLVSEGFGFYHSGIFLIDANQEYLVLQAANSAGGAKMLQRQHKLRLDATSIVGFSASRNEPRVALDVGTDAVFFNNPDLPETRSEMALPLRAGRKVIGALDVQSTQANAFTEEDIEILATLADQIAIAIENARLFTEARNALAESERTFERYVKQEWSTFAQTAKSAGYTFDGNRTIQIRSKDQKAKAKALAQTGRLSLETETQQITIPIKFRGLTVGFLDVKSKKGNRRWTRDELTLLESAAERAALALENTRLVETAQRRASRERMIGEISSRIGAVSNLDAIMQTAVEELGRRIGAAAEVTFEIAAENNPE
jgi:GAF domain-containing protein